MNPDLIELYTEKFGVEPASVEALRADGSDRKIYRLFGADRKSSVIGVSGVEIDENRAFISYSRSLRSAGLPVPEILAVGKGDAIYLEEDLGDLTLFRALVEGRAAEPEGATPLAVVKLYRSVVEMLPRLQVEGGRVIDYSVAYPHEEFDRQSMMWDLNYFKYHFLKLAKVTFNEARLERDFANLCDYLLEADRTHFMYRDFQSRNIMIRGEEPWFIDYQGGRRGALQYDIASLLYDAKADLNEDLRAGLLEHYLDALEKHVAVDRDTFTGHYRGFVLIRIMQAMGAYGYRGYYERKSHFLDSVPFAVRNIESIILSGAIPIEMPELVAAFVEIVRRSAAEADEQKVVVEKTLAGENDGMPRFATEPLLSVPELKLEDSSPVPVPPPVQADPVVPAEKAILTVRISSFSYRQGYPEELSENGGGFVFDCRALHNPGRYAEYRDLCGCDTPVVEFLEREESVAHFWHAVVTLIDGAVENYLTRGFTSLSVNFGCTGGQHRSVYFSERLARHLLERYPQVVVELRHREKARWPGTVVSPLPDSL